MNRIIGRTAGIIALLTLVINAQAQDDEKIIKRNKSGETIIITTNGDDQKKLNIEIKGDDITVNGKPLAEYKDGNVIIRRNKTMHNGEMADLSDIDAMGPMNRFRGGVTNYRRPPTVRMFGGGSLTNKAILGVGTEKADNGVSIVTVSDESAADKAGLKKGDIITAINDTKVTTPQELVTALGKMEPGDKITVTYTRDKKTQKATATLEKRSDTMTFSPAPSWNMDELKLNNNFDNLQFNMFSGKKRLGLRAQETEDGKGLKVLDVDDESAAEKAGIKEGDIITSFDGKDINNVDELRELSRPAMDKGNFKVKLLRDGKSQEVEVKIPKNLKSASL